MTEPFYTRTPRLLAATDQTTEMVREILGRSDLDLDAPDVRAAFIIGARLAARAAMEGEAGLAGICVLAAELERDEP